MSFRSTAQKGDDEFVRSSLDGLPRGTTLNLGAGYSGTPSAASRTIINVDLDPTVLHNTQRSFGVAADAERLPFRDGAFEGALLKDVLEHVPDPVAALTEVRRSCSDAARMIATVPRAIPRAVWNDPTHLRGFTKRALTVGLELGGWEVSHPIQRMGSIPGAGRFAFVMKYRAWILRTPGLGHRFGTNWLVFARGVPMALQAHSAASRPPAAVREPQNE